METKKLNRSYRVAFFSVIVLNLALISWGWYENYANMAYWKHALSTVVTLAVFWFAKKVYCKPKKVKDIFESIFSLGGMSGIFITIATGVAALKGNDLPTFVAVGEFLWSAFFFFIIQDEKKPHAAKAMIAILGLACCGWLSVIFPVLAALAPVMQILAILSVLYFFFGLGYLALGRED